MKTWKDGFELRKQLRDRYAEGNVATRTRANTSGREVWRADSTFDADHGLRADRS